MLHIRKILSILLTAVVILMLFPAHITTADSQIIYQTSVKETITSGATLEKITRFTANGWLNINVLRVDLSNPYIKVDTMTSTGSVKKLTSVLGMAQSRGAVAAINGGFFNWMKSEAGKGEIIGPAVESGKVVTAASNPGQETDYMATFSINNLNEVLYSYWNTKIKLITPAGRLLDVSNYNKQSWKDYNDFSTYYNDLTIIDRRWGDSSIGATANFPDIVEMVVDNGKVLEIRQAQPSVPIPANGFVVVTRQANINAINENFKVGDTVDMNITTTPDWNRLQMAVTGGAILVKDGQIPAKFLVDIPGMQPRTAIGSSRDGKQLLLVTVDGRQKSSIGMTQTELAQLMLEFGAYNAINLDGGGSTAMVTRSPGTGTLEVDNSPSDGMPRSVSTAVGIFSIAPPSSLDGLIIDTEDTNMFVNTSRRFTVKGYDRYFNPMEVSPMQVKWSVSGLDGYFSGNTFYPRSSGKGKIIASVGSVHSELDIQVLDSPVQLQLNNKLLTIPQNQTRAFIVNGKSKNGYSAVIYPSDVNWSVSGGLGSFDQQGNFRASASGTGYIDASIGSTHAYCGISVSSDINSSTDSFEAANASFTSYPSVVKGSYEISSEQSHSGKSSGKLTYDFSYLEGTRAAYALFSNGGVTLSADTSKIGLWVYNTHPSSNWLRAEVSDISGKKSLIDFTRTMEWTGWKYVEASLQGISSPSRLTRVYLAQVSPVSDSGSVYLDDLSLITSSYPVVNTDLIPKDTQPVDEANTSIDYQKLPGSFRFSVFGETRNPRNLLEKLLSFRLADRINSTADISAFVGNGEHNIMNSINVRTLITGSGYQSFDMTGSRFIQLDTSKQGLRASSASQWQWFLSQLDTAPGKNIFIFMADSPDTFSDKLEANLFKQILTRYSENVSKSIWVFYKDVKTVSTIEKGVRFISSAGLDAQGISPDNPDSAKYILVTVDGDKVVYELKPIVE